MKFFASILPACAAVVAIYAACDASAAGPPNPNDPEVIIFSSIHSLRTALVDLDYDLELFGEHPDKHMGIRVVQALANYTEAVVAEHDTVRNTYESIMGEKPFGDSTARRLAERFEELAQVETANFRRLRTPGHINDFAALDLKETVIETARTLPDPLLSYAEIISRISTGYADAVLHVAELVNVHIERLIEDYAYFG